MNFDTEMGNSQNIENKSTTTQPLRLKNEIDGALAEFDMYDEANLPFLFEKHLNLYEKTKRFEEVTFDEDIATDEETCRCAKRVLDKHLEEAIFHQIGSQQSNLHSFHF